MSTFIDMKLKKRKKIALCKGRKSHSRSQNAKSARFRISIVGNFFMKCFLLIYALIKLFFFFALWL